MDVILLERVPKLGQMGQIVSVKPGFARNFLLPRGKALRATEASKKKFEGMKADLEARNLELKNEAQAVGDKLNGTSYILIRQAGETGQLFGSVTSRDVADAITAAGINVSRNEVVMTNPIKTIGLHTVPVQLHADVTVSVTLNIARSAAEAEKQVKGEDLKVREELPTFETFNPEDMD
jgi:large subunit ribosomal protein L9